jgi:hypothetical protein
MALVKAKPRKTVIYKGEERTIRDLAKQAGVRYETMSHRIREWPEDRWLEKPQRHKESEARNKSYGKLTKNIPAGWGGL